MIEDVLIEPLKTFSDKKGKVLHMLRSDAPFFEGFGEVYFSTVNPGFVKGWKKHFRITQHFAVPVGNIKLVLYDDRKSSSSVGQIQEIFMGTENYKLVRIPPLIWYSFKAIGDSFALIANCIDSPYDAAESVTLVLDDNIPYKWGMEDK